MTEFWVQFGAFGGEEAINRWGEGFGRKAEKKAESRRGGLNFRFHAILEKRKKKCRRPEVLKTLK